MEILTAQGKEKCMQLPCNTNSSLKSATFCLEKNRVAYGQ